MKTLKKINTIIDKMPRWAGVIMIIVGTTFAGAHSAQSTSFILAQMLSANGVIKGAQIPSVFGWVFSSLITWLTFEVILMLFLMAIRPMVANVNRNALAHYARVVFSVGYILIGAVSLLYFFYPLFMLIGRTIVEFLIFTAFACLYYFLVSRKFVPPFLWGRLLLQMGIMYLLYHGIMSGYQIMNAFSAGVR